MRLAVKPTEQQQEAEPAGQPSRLGGTDIFRGALVIITAIAVGGFVISRGLDDTTTEAASETPETSIVGPASPETDEALDEGAVTGETQLGATPTTLPGATPQPTAAADDGTGADAMAETTDVATLRSPAEVKVLVLNGAGTQGIAARGTETLQAASYNTAAPKNATSELDSAIFYQEGYEAEANAVAAAFGTGLETLVQPYDPTTPPIDDIQNANVIVIIGGDNLIPLS